MGQSAEFHQPVLAQEILDLCPRAIRVVDCTLGDGGHAARFLERGASVLGIDQDPLAIGRAHSRLGDAAVSYHLGSAYHPDATEKIKAFHPDLILLDLGVSSRQLDDERLGFSFRPGVPLDMRMSGTGPTAADLVAQASVEEMTIWLRDYADMPQGRRLAAEIVRRRGRAPLATSDDLVNAIRGALGPRSGPSEFARVFQALRIAVNQELTGLSASLPEFRDALGPNGALAAISYHSGEDRAIKNAFREWSARCICPPHFPICVCRGRSLGRLVTRHPVVAGPAEVEENPRARSAKLRVFEVAGEP